MGALRMKYNQKWLLVSLFIFTFLIFSKTLLGVTSLAVKCDNIITAKIRSFSELEAPFINRIRAKIDVINVVDGVDPGFDYVILLDKDNYQINDEIVITASKEWVCNIGKK